MDFPANVTTNIHVIEDVETINWAQWAWTDPQLPKYPEDEQDEQLAVIAAAYNVREENGHIYWDAAEERIWLFDLRASPKTDTLDQVLTFHGFSKLSHGTLDITDLQSANSGILKTENAASPGFSSTVSKHLSPSGPTKPQVAIIYEKAMIAISSTFNQHLAKNDGWMLLGRSTCVNVLRLGKKPFEQSCLDASGSKSNKINFQTRWSATGHLTLLTKRSQFERLETVAHNVLITDRALERGTPILLSPSGACVKYHGMLSIANESISFNLINSLKTRCATYLNHQGLPVSPNADWVLVEVPSNYPSQSQMPQFEQSFLTMWPTEYALCKEARDCGQSLNIKTSERSEIVDPVARAESWYVGKAVRAKKAEAIRKEAELKSQQQSSHQDTSDVDVSSEITSPPFRDIIPQDVSGVYPTPPDGLLSQLSETSVNNAQQEASPNFITVDQTIETYNNPGYNGGENEDLFGDMEMDMVGEADFNFFDEPEMESEEGNDMMQDVPNGGDLAEKIHGMSPILPGGSSLANDRTSQDSPATEMIQGNEAKSSTIDAGIEDAAPLMEDRKSVLETKHLNVEISPLGLAKPTLVRGNGALEEYSPHQLLQDIPPSGEKALPGRGSFNSLSLMSLDFDRKYGNEGHFGCLPGKRQNFDPSKFRKPGRYYEIPKIGFKGSSTASPGSEEDDDMTDDQPTAFRRYDISEDLRQMNEQISRKRKRVANGSVSRPATPTSPESVSGKSDQDLTTGFNSPPSAFFNPQTSQVLTSRALQVSASLKSLYTSDEHSFIQVAQLLADQIALGNPCSSVFLKTSAESGRKSRAESSYHELLTSIVSGVFPSIKTRSLLNLIDISDEKSDISQNIYKMDGCPVGVQRMGTMTDILPSATPFWEGLSLCPSSGPKDVNAFCIFPKKDYLVQPSKTFLEMIKGAYQACNLGRHTHDGPQSAYPHGLVPISAPMIDTKSSYVNLGKHLAGLRFCGGNFIIYMLNTSEDDNAIPGLCNSFLDLFWSYRLALENEDLKNPNDLVLQIVPSRMIFESDKLVLPSPADYKRLAVQVYDRCSPISGNGQDPMAPFLCAPAIRLPKLIPKVINFRLASESLSALLDTEDCLHLAYKWEIGQQWLAASWTNSLGTLQWNAAYWLSKDDGVHKAFSQAVVAMLETTTEMLQPRRASCRIFIANDGLFEAHEVQTWSRLNSERTVPLNLTLLKINSNPSLELFSPRVPNMVSELPDLLATPVSTPHTTGLSPEVSTHISTPGAASAQGAVPAAFGDNDEDARLIDITDETWAAIVSSANVKSKVDSVDTKTKPQGYLIKRAGTQDQDGLLLVQVNIIHGSKPLQQLLKEVLAMYRNLALLARVRNVIDPVKGTLPIHVAAAGKAYAALCKSMRYGG